MQCISNLNKNSLLLTFNICIYSRLRSNSIAVFSTSTRFGIFHPAGLVMIRMCWIPSKTSIWNKQFKRQKRKMIKPIWMRKAYFSIEMFSFCSLRLTIKCNSVFWFRISALKCFVFVRYYLQSNATVFFGLVCTENTRKRLKASKNNWIRACMSFWTLPIPTGCKLKF